MNKQQEPQTKAALKENNNLNARVKKLSRQYQDGELTSMDALIAIREVLTNLN